MNANSKAVQLEQVALSSILLNNSSYELLLANLTAENLKLLNASSHPVSQIFVPHFGNEDNASKEIKLAWVQEQGFIPVPHLAARVYQQPEQFAEDLEMYKRLGIKKLLLLGGSPTDKQATGPYRQAYDLLTSNLLKCEYFSHLAFAGHPEQHPEQSKQVMDDALYQKLAYANEHGFSAEVITQFSFSASCYADFLLQMQTFADRLGIPSLDVRLGISGKSSFSSLLRYAKLCGVGKSISFISQRMSDVGKLAFFDPRTFLLKIDEQINMLDSSSLSHLHMKMHIYPFGALADSVAAMQISDSN